jgi:hypothetical protein
MADGSNKQRKSKKVKQEGTPDMLVSGYEFNKDNRAHKHKIIFNQSQSQPQPQPQ